MTNHLLLQSLVFTVLDKNVESCYELIHRFGFRLNSLVELRSFENRVFALNEESIKLIHNVAILF